MASKPYIVSALKHRPSVFAEVLAQDHITRTLKHSLDRGRIANAYLFSGSRGTGKTTTARLLAKALNCEQLQEAEPCNQCESCTNINKGIHIDILEIDAASNRGIDEIRELRSNARFAPVSGRYKVYIIDEAHMLTKDANNALLKTLEEPPAQSRFILATTEPDKILPTILSRCQCFQFRRIPSQIIVEHLKKIVSQQDTLEIADASELDRILFHIARSSQGGLRDALSSLDQLLAYCSGKLELAEVEEVLGVIGFEQLDRFIRAVIQHDLQDILFCIDEIVNRGKEIGLFLKECLQFLRNLAVAKVSANTMELLDLPDDYCKQLQKTADLVSLEQILYVTDVFWDAERRMYFSLETRLIFEMASIKAAKAGQAVKIQDLLHKLSSFASPRSVNRGESVQTWEDQSHAPNSPHTPVQETPLLDTNAIKNNAKAETKNAAKAETSEKIPSQKEHDETTQSVAPAAQANAGMGVTQAETAQTNLLSSSWNQILLEIEEKSSFLAGMLENSIPIELADDELRISIPSGSNFTFKALERPHNRKALSEIVEKSFGRSLKVKFETHDVPQVQIETQAEKEKPVNSASMKELFNRVQDDDAFNKLQDVLPGRVVNIKPE